MAWFGKKKDEMADLVSTSRTEIAKAHKGRDALSIKIEQAMRSTREMVAVMQNGTSR